MSSWRIKVGNDPTVEEWLKAQKSKSGSVQFLIKIFAHLHGNSDITKMSFDELFETGETKVGAIATTGERSEQRYEVTANAKHLRERAIANTGERSEQRYEVTGETKVGAIVNTQQNALDLRVRSTKVGANPPLPIEKKSQEQREPTQKEKKKDNMLLSML